MKKIVILIYLCFVFSIVNAQKKQNVYFFKINGSEVNTKDSADFVRVITEPDSGETNFILQEYHANGKRKTVGKVSAFEPRLVFEGVILRMDTLGKRKEITTYEKSMPLGMSYHYFNTGKLHKQIEYLPHTSDINRPDISISLPFGVKLPDAKYNPNAKLIYFADSLGKIYVEGGNGHFVETTKSQKDESIEEGDYKDGIKHGIWKGSSQASGTSFVETYEKGKLISGESVKEGVKYPYTDWGQPPSFKEGMNKFYEYVSYALRYPNDAVKNKIEGTTILEFTVERDGRTSEIGVKKSASPSLDDEAMRVVKSSPKWIPGTMRGIPVRVRYTVPIKFVMR